jgi:hypothetical protein
VSEVQRGRPRKMDEDAKRAIINLRATQETKDELVRAGRRYGRSLSQEVEHRLELSLARERDAQSPSAAALVDMVRLAANRIEASTGKSWAEDADTWFQLELVIWRILQLNNPAPSATDDVELRREALRAAERASESAREILTAMGDNNLLAVQKWGRTVEDQRELYYGALEGQINVSRELQSAMAALEERTKTLAGKAELALGSLANLFLVGEPKRGASSE